MVSALRRFAFAVPLVALASGCQPPNEQEDAAASAVDRNPTTDVIEQAASEAPTVAEAPASEPEISEPQPIEPPAEPETPVEVGMNDVSILLPPPVSADDPVLAITDLAFAGQAVWPDEIFTQFLTVSNTNSRIADEDVVSGRGGVSISLAGFEDKAVWHVASIRIDLGAPGISEAIASEFGQSPQIRLVLQPVTAGPSGPKVHDVAAHMIYSFVRPPSAPADGCILPVLDADLESFQAVVNDIHDLKTRLAAGEIGGEPVATDGPLGVHPAADPETASLATRTAFRDALEVFLEKHLHPARLSAMAVMGLPAGAPEPWIFLAMQRRGDAVEPVPSPALAQVPGSFRFAQMLDRRRGETVSPTPVNNNLNPVTCRFGPLVPAGTASGVATAELFASRDPDRMREVVDVIADPTRAHFFNTDCVSCHTETRREMDVLRTNKIGADIDPDVLPTELWNVRNFGWFPSFLDRSVLRATATRRTATETAEVVEAINASLDDR